MPNANSSLPQRSLLAGGNALKIGLFGANCSSGRAVTKVPERWSGTWADNLAARADGRRGRHRLHAADRPLEGLRRRHRLSGGDARNRHLGLRAAGSDQAHHRVRHGARAAVSSDHRGEADGHRRSHRRRPLRTQHRGRLERGRVRDVRRRAARARHALRIRAGMDRRHQADVVGPRRFRFRRRSSSSSRTCAPSPSPTAARSRSS